MLIALRCTAMNLGPGESIVISATPAATFGVWARWVFTCGLYEIWRRQHRFTVTNQRVVVTKGILNRTERVVPLSKVQDVTVRTGLFTGYVVLSSAGGGLGIEQLGPVWRRQAGAIGDAITRQLRQAA